MSTELGKTLIAFGLLITAVGVFFIFKDKLPWLSNLGNLPGDISIKNENSQVFIPLTTSLLLSLFFSVLFWLIGKFKS